MEGEWEGALKDMRILKLDVESHTLLRCSSWRLESRGLPRDVREDVFRRDFSQEQRLLLEKWMKELGEAKERASNALVARTSSLPIRKKPTAEVKEPDLVVAPQSAPALSLRVSPKQPLPPTKQKRKRDTGMKNLLVRKTGKYAAEVCFDATRISTRDYDLSTAVEFLMVLTSIKQKMLCARAQGFEERLREAVVSACNEHGKSVPEMGLRFGLYLSAGSFIGRYPVTPGAERPKAGLPSQSVYRLRI